MSNEREIHQLLLDVLDYIRQEQLIALRLPKVQKPASLKKEEPPLSDFRGERKPQRCEKSSFPFEEASLRKLMVETLPEARMSNQIPSDHAAKRKNPEVGLLAFHERQLPFLQKLARAITHHLAPAKIWKADRLVPCDSLTLFLATHADILSHPSLKKECKESPSPTLFGIPLLFLSPMDDYQNNPSLKRALWNHLCQILQ